MFSARLLSSLLEYALSQRSQFFEVIAVSAPVKSKKMEVVGIFQERRHLLVDFYLGICLVSFNIM